MNCPDDRRLFEIHTGDGAPADRAHAAACPACAARLHALGRDLARIDSVLRGAAPAVRRAAPAIDWRLAPMALAAALLLAVTLGRQGTTTPDADTSAVDALALADEVSALFDDDGVDPSTATDTTTRSTCTYGDPLLQVGCDEPAVMQIAWR